MTLCQEYKDELFNRKIKVVEERWKNVLLFRKILLQKVHEHNLVHEVRKLSDLFFRHEKKRYISSPTFTTCLKAQQYKINESSTMTLYHSFDILWKNEFDWRTFIYMLKITLEGIDEDFASLVQFAFQCHLGRFDGIYSPCQCKIKVQNIHQVLEMLVRPDMVHPVEKFFIDEIANNVSTQYFRRGRSPVRSSFVSYNVFVATLKKFVSKTEYHDIKSFQQKYYPMAFFKYRRCLRYMTHFVEINSRKMIFATFRQWKSFTSRVTRIRSILNSITSRTSNSLLVNAMHLLWENAIINSAANAIQYAWRSCAAKNAMREKQFTKWCALCIQKVFRGSKTRQQFCSIKSRRHYSAIQIQRCVRKTLALHIFQNKLQTIMDLKHQQCVHEKQIQHDCQLRQNAIIIQRRYRDKLAQRTFHEAVNKKQREFKVIAEMQQMLAEEENEEKIHEKQTIVYKRDSLSQWLESKNIERHTVINVGKAQKLHLQIRGKKYEQREADKKREHMEDVEHRKQKLKEDMFTKELQDADAFARHCSLCIRVPETALERKLGRELKQKIKRR